MTASAKRMNLQPANAQSVRAVKRPARVIPISEPVHTLKPASERSEAYRLGLTCGRYFRLEHDANFNFHLMQTAIANGNAAEFAAGFCEGLCLKPTPLGGA